VFLILIKTLSKDKQVHNTQTVLQTSCSLLHLIYLIKFALKPVINKENCDHNHLVFCNLNLGTDLTSDF